MALPWPWVTSIDSKSILLNILLTIMQHPVISDVHATIHVWGEYGKGIQDRYSLNTRVYEQAHAHTLCLLNPGFLVPSEARSLLGLRQKSMASPIFLAFL